MAFQSKLSSSDHLYYKVSRDDPSIDILVGYMLISIGYTIETDTVWETNNPINSGPLVFGTTSNGGAKLGFSELR